MVNVLVFKRGEVWFGIETYWIKAVTKDLTWINNEQCPDFANGVVEYEGRKVFAIDLEKKFSCRTNVSLTGVEFIMVSYKGREFAMSVDEVIDIFQVSKKDIMPIPAFAEKNMSKNFFKGVLSINDTLVLLLDVSKF